MNENERANTHTHTQAVHCSFRTLTVINAISLIWIAFGDSPHTTYLTLNEITWMRTDWFASINFCCCRWSKIASHLWLFPEKLPNVCRTNKTTKWIWFSSHELHTLEHWIHTHTHTQCDGCEQYELIVSWLNYVQ